MTKIYNGDLKLKAMGIAGSQSSVPVCWIGKA